MITFASCVWITKKETQTQMKSNETKVKTTKEQNKQLKLKRKKKKHTFKKPRSHGLKTTPKFICTIWLLMTHISHQVTCHRNRQ